MSPNTRKKDKHLPRRVYFKDGRYRYKVEDHNRERLGKSWITLGKTEAEMWKSYSELMTKLEQGAGMAVLFDRYQNEVIPTKKPRTQKDNLAELKKIRPVFEHMEPQAVTMAHAYQYLDIRGKQSKTQANHEMALLRHIFTMAVRWGALQHNPLFGLRKHVVAVRDRVPEAWEAIAVKKHCSTLLKLWIDFKWQTGLRQGDMISLKVSDITKEGIKVKAGKNARRGLIHITPELQATIDQILGLNKVQGMTLFCNARGKPLTSRVIQQQFRKAVLKAIECGDLQEAFTENDIRSSFATLSEEQGHDASDQLLHRSGSAKNHYVHKKTTPVKPLKPL